MRACTKVTSEKAQETQGSPEWANEDSSAPGDCTGHVLSMWASTPPSSSFIQLGRGGVCQARCWVISVSHLILSAAVYDAVSPVYR